jgi:hypothetical protein
LAQPRDWDVLLTAETHNFPCAVAPYPGAETGAGGRIRDTHATGIGSIMGAATAGYCVGNLHMDGCGCGAAASTSPPCWLPRLVVAALKRCCGNRPRSSGARFLTLAFPGRFCLALSHTRQAKLLPA